MNKASKSWYLFRFGLRLDVDFGLATRSLPPSSDLSLGPEHREILREGALPTHEIVVVLQR